MTTLIYLQNETQLPLYYLRLDLFLPKNFLMRSNGVGRFN